MGYFFLSLLLAGLIYLAFKTKRAFIRKRLRHKQRLRRILQQERIRLLDKLFVYDQKIEEGLSNHQQHLEWWNRKRTQLMEENARKQNEINQYIAQWSAYPSDSLHHQIQEINQRLVQLENLINER